MRACANSWNSLWAWSSCTRLFWEPDQRYKFSNIPFFCLLLNHMHVRLGSQGHLAYRVIIKTGICGSIQQTGHHLCSEKAARSHWINITLIAFCNKPIIFVTLYLLLLLLSLLFSFHQRRGFPLHTPSFFLKTVLLHCQQQHHGSSRSFSHRRGARCCRWWIRLCIPLQAPSRCCFLQRHRQRHGAFKSRQHWQTTSMETASSRRPRIQARNRHGRGVWFVFFVAKALEIYWSR